MSTSPMLRGRARWAARAAVLVATVFAAISASTAVVGLDPVEQELPQTVASPTTTTVVEATPVVIPSIAADPCSAHLADFCVEVPIEPPARVDALGACTTGEDHTPGGRLTVVGNTDRASEDAIRIRVEVEEGLAINGACFAAAAFRILRDERGWSSIDDVSFARVDDESYDFRLILASPRLTDELCWPARTAGEYSCRNKDNVVINLNRWEIGTDEFSGQMTTYRTYLINHEVGHFLGRGHVECPGPGEPAPVMMQQTKGLDGCLPNGWPTKDEH